MKEKVSKIFKDLKEGKLSFEKAEQQVLDLFDVSQQGELLLFFLSKINKDAIDLYKEGKGQIVVDHFLKNNNCV